MNLFFVNGVRVYSNFIDLHVTVQLFQHHLLKRLFFPHCIFLPLLIIHLPLLIILLPLLINYPLVFRFISGLSSMFHYHISVFLPVPCCFLLLWFCCIIWSLGVLAMLPTLLFFVGIALAILDILWFHINFRIICSHSVKKCHE